MNSVEFECHKKMPQLDKSVQFGFNLLKTSIAILIVIKDLNHNITL
jgi:hypothetical protein